MPKGVECPHAGYVNLALTYADYFDLLPGMDATSLTSSLGHDGSISIQRPGVGLRRGHADEGADPVGSGASPHPSRS